MDLIFSIITISIGLIIFGTFLWLLNKGIQASLVYLKKRSDRLKKKVIDEPMFLEDVTMKAFEDSEEVTPEINKEKEETKET